jgi:hypothetical protein
MSSDQVYSIGFRLIFRSGKGQKPELQTELHNQMTKLVKSIREGAGEVYHDEYNVNILRREEILSLVPRKVHYAPVNSPHQWTRKLDGDQIPAQVCKTPRVSKRWLTEKSLEVTCKLCLKYMSEHPELK